MSHDKYLIKPNSILGNDSRGESIARKYENSSNVSVHKYERDCPAEFTLDASLQKWNQPKINTWRILAACYGFLIMGANDGAYGALIPYLESYYSLNYYTVSLIFLSPVVGYASSALLLNIIHTIFGQRGIAFIGPGVRLVAYIIVSQHPPYPLTVIAFVLAGFGNGLEDGAWNAWIGNMEKANEILGFLHGAYGLGATLSPLIATAMITQGKLQWYAFYYIAIGAAVIESCAAISVFWQENGQKYRSEHLRTSNGNGRKMKQALINRVTWICSIFLLVYVGIEASIGGWVVVFMMNIRNATPFIAGLSATCFWLGITMGRIVLGFVTGRIGEKLAILVYIVTAIGLHLIFYLVPSLPVSYVAVSLQGVFLGPMFPAAVVAATQLLPQDLHVSSIGFAAAFGAAGACVLPFAIGGIAQVKGVQVLMPTVLAMLVVMGAVWLLLPGFKR